MSACHLLAISLHLVRRPRGCSLVDARGEPRLACVKMVGSPVAVRLWRRGRPIEVVSKVEAMGGDERDGGGGGMGPSLRERWVFRPLALRARMADGDAIDSVRSGHRQSFHDESEPHICLPMVGTGAVERLAPLNASFSASATLYRPIQPSGNAWNNEICVLEFLEAYPLDSDRYSGNVRPIPLRCPIH